MTLVINHSNQLSLSYSQKHTVLLPFNKLSKPNVNNTIYVSLIFKDNPFPRYIKHVATYICGLLVNLMACHRSNDIAVSSMEICFYLVTEVLFLTPKLSLRQSGINYLGSILHVCKVSNYLGFQINMYMYYFYVKVMKLQVEMKMG